MSDHVTAVLARWKLSAKKYFDQRMVKAFEAAAVKLNKLTQRRLQRMTVYEIAELYGFHPRVRRIENCPNCRTAMLVRDVPDHPSDASGTRDICFGCNWTSATGPVPGYGLMPIPSNIPTYPARTVTPQHIVKSEIGIRPVWMTELGVERLKATSLKEGVDFTLPIREQDGE